MCMATWCTIFSPSLTFMFRPTVCLLLVAATLCHAELTDEQRSIPLEVDSPDPTLAKIVLLAGSVSNKPGQHEYFAGCAMLSRWLKEVPGTWPVLVADGWPKNEAILDHAKAIVVYADGGPKLPFLAPERWARMKALMDAGAGLVMLHQAVDVPETQAEELKSWLGGVWQKDIGCRGHWDMTFSEFPKHAVLTGVGPFAAPFDGWLFNLHFAPGAVPLLRGQVPDSARSTLDAKQYAGRPEVVAWAYERANGGRSFAFTGCDLHRNWSAEGQRRMVTNGVLWAARQVPPPEGAPVSFAAGDLAQNLDAKAPGK